MKLGNLIHEYENNVDIAIQKNIDEKLEDLRKWMITVETKEGECIDLPISNVIDAFSHNLNYYNYQTNKDNYKNYHNENKTVLPKDEQIIYKKMDFIYIEYEPKYTVIECKTPNKRAVKKMQKYLKDLNVYKEEYPLDGKIDETFVRAILLYKSKFWFNSGRNDWYYKTVDGNIRHIKEPSYDTKYSIWVTESPFSTLEEIFSSTVAPTSLGSSNFFCNYINKGPASENTWREQGMIIDTLTWNKLYANSWTEVNIEWEYHRNIQRFLIKPFYEQFWIPKERARINATFDLYRYYLVLHSWDIDAAKTDTLTLLEEYIDPIVNSSYEKRSHENYFLFWYDEKPNENFFISSYEAFKNDKDNHNIIESVLIYNSTHPEKGYKRSEIQDIVIDYFIHFRRYDKWTASQKVSKLIDQVLDEVKIRKIELEKSLLNLTVEDEKFRKELNQDLKRVSWMSFNQE